MARNFNGTNEEIRCAIGACTATFGTFAVIMRRGVDGAHHGLIGLHGSNGLANFALELDNTNLIALNRKSGGVGAASKSTTTVTVADGWVLIAATKTTGTTTPRFHKYRFDTGVWVHENGTTSLSDGDSVAGGTVRFGEWQDVDDFNGDLAAMANWGASVSDAAIEQLAINIEKWFVASPAGFWIPKNIVSEPLLDETGQGADQTAISGTTFVEANVPNFSFEEPRVVVGLGVQQHAGTFNTAGQNFTLDLGVHSIRLSYNHGDHEFGVQWAEDNGVDVCFFLGYGVGNDCTTAAGRQAYADRSAELAGRYGPHVRYYEVWNEWNGGFGGLGCSHGQAGTPCTDHAMYVDLLRRTYLAIKAVNPQALVIGGATGGIDINFLTGMLNNGAADYMDLFSCHPYVFTSTLYTVGANGTATAGVAKFIEGVTDAHDLILSMSGKDMPIAITEDGRSDSVNSANYQRTADYLRQLYYKTRAVPFIEGIWWYELEDEPANQPGWGLVTSGNVTKPAYDQMKIVARTIPPPPPLAPPTFDVELRSTTGFNVELFSTEGVVSKSTAIGLESSGRVVSLGPADLEALTKLVVSKSENVESLSSAVPLTLEVMLEALGITLQTRVARIESLGRATQTRTPNVESRGTIGVAKEISARLESRGYINSERIANVEAKQVALTPVSKTVQLKLEAWGAVSQQRFFNVEALLLGGITLIFSYLDREVSFQVREEKSVDVQKLKQFENEFQARQLVDADF